MLNSTQVINGIPILSIPRDLIDSGWAYIFQNSSEWFLLSYATMYWTFAIYFGLGYSFLIVDLTKWPKWFYAYKIQKTPVDKRTLRKLTWVLGLSTLFITCSVIYIVALISGYSDKFGYRVERELPTIQEVLRDLAVFGVIEELIFYYSHRLIHIPFLYKRIHKLHHEFQSPISLAAGYAHPIEQLISNLIPLFAGPVIMNCHIVTAWLIFAIGLVVTLYDHSGYGIPWLPFGHHPYFHDYHHESFRFNFGVLGLLDWFHGTWRARGDIDPKKLVDPAKNE